MSRMRLKTEAYVSNGQTLWAYSLLRGGNDTVYSTASGFASQAAADTAGKGKLADLAARKLKQVGV